MHLALFDLVCFGLAVQREWTYGASLFLFVGICGTGCDESDSEVPGMGMVIWRCDEREKTSIGDMGDMKEQSWRVNEKREAKMIKCRRKKMKGVKSGQRYIIEL